MPKWIVLIIVLSAIGPMMRMVFGEHAPARKGRKARDESRLESALAERDAVIEDLQRRLYELESRLDFTERLLAERREPIALP